MAHDFGLKDNSVWTNGNDVTAADLREQAVCPDLAEKAIQMHDEGKMVNPFGKLSFRASRIFIYRQLYNRKATK